MNGHYRTHVQCTMNFDEVAGEIVERRGGCVKVAHYLMSHLFAFTPACW
jgi:hypothetical protein